MVGAATHSQWAARRAARHNPAMPAAKPPEKPAAKTNAQRQADLRARREEAGLKQLVVYAHPDDHRAIKAHVEKTNAARVATLGASKEERSNGR